MTNNEELTILEFEKPLEIPSFARKQQKKEAVSEKLSANQWTSIMIYAGTLLLVLGLVLRLLG